MLALKLLSLKVFWENYLFNIFKFFLKVLFKVFWRELSVIKCLYKWVFSFSKMFLKFCQTLNLFFKKILKKTSKKHFLNLGKLQSSLNQYLQYLLTLNIYLPCLGKPPRTTYHQAGLLTPLKLIQKRRNDDKTSRLN